MGLYGHGQPGMFAGYQTRPAYTMHSRPYQYQTAYGHGQLSPYQQGSLSPHHQGMHQGGISPMMMMFLASMRQMMQYMNHLEHSVNNGTTSTENTEGTEETSSTENTEAATETNANPLEEQAIAFEAQHTIDSLAEKHVLDMSNGSQQVTVDGKSNVVFAIKNEGANTYAIEGKKNDLIIESFDADDKIILDDSALNYDMEITEDGTIKLRNKDNKNSIEMAIDPSMIDPNDEKATLKNILSNIESPDGETFWEVVEDQSFNEDKARKTVTKDIGKNKQDKKINNIEGDNTHFILNDKKAGWLKKSRQDNIYNLTGHQNIYEVKGDHGANRFVMNNSASKLTVHQFGHDDSLQFIHPQSVEITSEKRSGKGWEITMIDKATGSEVTVKTGNADHDAEFVKERMGEINDEDGLSKSRKKRSKRNMITKIVAGVALIAASVVTFGGTGALGAAVLGSAGVTAAAGSIGAIAVGTGIMAGANFGIGKLLPDNPTHGITELGAKLGGRPEWLVNRLETENLVS